MNKIDKTNFSLKKYVITPLIYIIYNRKIKKINQNTYEACVEELHEVLSDS